MKTPAFAPLLPPPPGKSPANRSLERGILVLRAFRQGSALLGNGEIAERTGLSPATVSRLAQTLVGTGFLVHDRAARAYRLGAPVLSLAHAMRTGSQVLQVAAPLMRTLAEKLRINVGMAVADGAEMVYLESIRYNRKVSLRSVVSGQRVPMELTSLGRAHLAVLAAPQREALMQQFQARRAAEWPQLQAEIDAAVAQVLAEGFCTASWQPEVVALATPLVVAGQGVYVVNASVATQEPLGRVAAVLLGPLLALAAQIALRLGSGVGPAG